MNLEEIGKSPISGDKPAGEDVAYEPEFELLQAEIDKMSVVSAAGEVDWKKVVELSTTLLSDKGKHLLVCVYLARGLMETMEFKGLCLGTKILKDVISEYWDNMYPPKKRKRGRINAVKWWYDKTEGFLRSLVDGPEQDEEEVQELKSLLKELDQVLDEKMGADAPILRPLIQLVDRLKIKKKASVSEEEKSGPEQTPSMEETQKQKEVQVEHKTSQTAPLKPPASGSREIDTGKLESQKDVNRLLGRCLNDLSQIVKYYMEKDLSNPMLYEINRFCAWVDVDVLPVVQEGNKTMLPPPDESIKSNIQGLINSREYEDAVRACESRVKEFIFWLDLSYFSAQALQELGGKYQKAYEAVSYITTSFVQRLPGIESLAFSDGTPFVGAETKAWIKGFMGGDDLGDQGTVDRDPFFVALEEEAKELVKKKDIPQALVVWQRGIDGGRGVRQKFQCRLELIKLLLKSGKKELALPHIDLLLKDIDLYKLDMWEPDLSVKAFTTIIDVLDGTEEQNERRMEIINRLICLSPSLAFKIL